MNKIKETALKLWKDESGQGATEYIILLVVVVSIGFLFKDKIISMVKGRTDAVGQSLGNFGVQENF